MKDIQIPFVKGFDTAGAPKAYSEPGKLRRAKNLCIRPTQKDALSARNSATLNAALSYVSSECNWRIFECEDRIHLLKPTGISMLNSGENGWEAVSTTRNLDLISADRYEASSFDVDGSVRNTAIARNSNGDELSVIAGRPSWLSGDFAVLAQPYVNGVKRATRSITGTFSSPGQNHWQNVYVFAVGTTGFLIVHGQPAATSIQFRFYDIATDAFSAVGTVTNSFVLDAVLTNTGRVAVLYRNTVTNYPTVGLFDLSSTPTASATATALHAALTPPGAAAVPP